MHEMALKMDPRLVRSLEYCWCIGSAKTCSTLQTSALRTPFPALRFPHPAFRTPHLRKQVWRPSTTDSKPPCLIQAPS